MVWPWPSPWHNRWFDLDTHLGIFVQQRGVLTLPSHGESMQCILNRVGVQTYRSDRQNVRYGDDLLLDLEKLLDLCVDDGHCWFGLDELAITPVHVVPPQEVVQREMIDVLVHDAAQLCSDKINMLCSYETNCSDKTNKLCSDETNKFCSDKDK